MEFLRQVITQQRGSNDLGMISYTDAVGYSASANFLDDFSGPSGITSRVFGAKVLHPDQFRQTYFFQDNWKATPTLALTLGLRYENFGQFANALYPTFSGFDPSQFLVRHEVNRDNNDFGPLSASRGRLHHVQAASDGCSATGKRSGAADTRSVTIPTSRN